MTPELLVPVGAMALMVPVVTTPESASKVTEAFWPTLTLTRSASLIDTRARMVERSEISTALLLELVAEAADAPERDDPLPAQRLAVLRVEDGDQPDTGAVTVRLSALSIAWLSAVDDEVRLACAESTPASATVTCCLASFTARASTVGVGSLGVATGCCVL